MNPQQSSEKYPRIRALEYDSSSQLNEETPQIYWNPALSVEIGMISAFRLLWSMSQVSWQLSFR